MDQQQGSRPVHAIVDCATGQTVHMPLSDTEIAEQQQRGQAAADAEAAQRAADAALRAQVDAHPDPVVKALAARLFGGAP